MKMPADLPTSVPELQALILEENAQFSALEESYGVLQEEYGSLKQKYHFMVEQFKLAQQRRFARSSESNVLQQEMQFDEAEVVPAEELPKEDNTITVTYTRNKPKRRTLPDNLSLIHISEPTRPY